MDIAKHISRIKFCIKISVNLHTLSRLIINTIRLSIYRKCDKLYNKLLSDQKASRYKLKMFGKRVELFFRVQDLPVFYEIFKSEIYSLPDEWIKNNNVIVDLGSHIGFSTNYLWLNYFSHSFFYCIEPSKNNINLLRRNTLEINCELIEGAVSSSTGNCFLNKNSMSYNYRIDNDIDDGERVNCYTLDDIINKYAIDKIDILKIDIEGSEKELFSNAKNWIDIVRTIIIEIHKGYSLEQFKSDLKDYGFEVYGQGSLPGLQMICARKNL